MKEYLEPEVEVIEIEDNKDILVQSGCNGSDTICENEDSGCDRLVW